MPPGPTCSSKDAAKNLGSPSFDEIVAGEKNCRKKLVVQMKIMNEAREYN